MPSVKKSRSSFQPYVINEMTFVEGMEEMVIRTKMFTPDEFSNIYDVIGGHMGSYASLWYLIRYENMTIHNH